MRGAGWKSIPPTMNIDIGYILNIIIYYTGDFHLPNYIIQVFRFFIYLIRSLGTFYVKPNRRRGLNPPGHIVHV